MSASNCRIKDESAYVKDPAIVSYRRSADLSSIASVTIDASVEHRNGSSVKVSQSASAITHSSNSSSVTNQQPRRETGVIEKLLHSYGFIQCLEREARLFFHYSEFGGDADTMRTGEFVEFQQSVDRRTGKPIAVSVVRSTRVPNLKQNCEIISDEAVTGTVLAEAKIVKNRGSEGEAPGLLDGMGRVTYEQSGETFFLPYGLEDVELGGQRLKAGDKVEFFLSTDEKNGNIRARRIKLVKLATPPTTDLYQGVVCSLKENYGFIERADIVKEIFFHFSEFQDDIKNLVLGDDVQYSIQIRNNKEVAVNVQKLPLGTVIFEDVGTDKRRGKILKTLKTGVKGDPLAGRIVSETLSGPIEIPYGDRDQLGDYTLQLGDIVEFNIATDRRDKLQRATNINLSEDTFLISKEKREKGYIVTMKEGYGFIRCTDRDARMFFHYSEMLDVDREIKLQQEVEFTVVPDPSSEGRQIAVRIKYLPKGTIALEHYLPEKYFGTVEKEAGVTHLTAPGKALDPESPGIILYDVNNTKQTILFLVTAIDGCTPRLGNKVEFQVCEYRKNNTKNAVNVRVINEGSETATLNKQDDSRELGFVSVLLPDGSGFIATVDHEKEFKFNNAGELQPGDEVQFTVSKTTASVPTAENVRKLKHGTISLEDKMPGVFDGKVVRAMHSSMNHEKTEHTGLIQLVPVADKSGEEGGTVTLYPFDITSLIDKTELLQKGDLVRFQLFAGRGTGKQFAANVALAKRVAHARVESIKGQTAYLSSEADDGKKLSFRLSDTSIGGDISVGDEVEYVTLQNQSTGRFYASVIRKISERQRPERLISRLKSVGDEMGPRMVAIRQPRGPDGTTGFKQERKPWKAGFS